MVDCQQRSRDYSVLTSFLCDTQIYPTLTINVKCCKTLKEKANFISYTSLNHRMFISDICFTQTIPVYIFLRGLCPHINVQLQKVKYHISSKALLEIKALNLITIIQFRLRQNVKQNCTTGFMYKLDKQKMETASRLQNL